MTKVRKLKINISKEIGSVSSLLLLPTNATSLLVLSHGAGAGMEHAFMEMLAQELAAQQVGTLRFNFAYMERGGGPDRPKKAHPAIVAAVKKALKYADGLTLLAGGKSFGGRMTSQVAAKGELDAAVKGIVYYGFPLHAPGKPGLERAAHLSDISIPQLFLQGTRDALARFDLIEAVCVDLKKAHLVRMEGSNHSFKTLKRSGITHEEAVAQLARETTTFAGRLR
ncbi:MAG: dienelactone hydrolase family protein [Saprospiraceae bacterium]|nr:dienelactone hydrolase family protein [Saprospiraceae bacterium]